MKYCNYSLCNDIFRDMNKSFNYFLSPKILFIFIKHHN